MKNIGIGSLALVMVIVIGARSAWAVPPFKNAFDAKYGTNEAIKAASSEAKCNVCHFGNSKKNLNDFGKAMKQLAKKDNYKKERVDAEPDKVKEELNAVFAKLEGEKSKGGETFGDRLKAGKLPGTPEEGK